MVPCKMPKREWTAEERQFLRNNYREMTNAELAYQLGATVCELRPVLIDIAYIAETFTGR